MLDEVSGGGGGSVPYLTVPWFDWLDGGEIAGEHWGCMLDLLELLYDEQRAMPLTEMAERLDATMESAALALHVAVACGFIDKAAEE